MVTMDGGFALTMRLIERRWSLNRRDLVIVALALELLAYLN